MAFNELQRKWLSAKLRRRFVKTKTVNGSALSFIEGWHAVAEANRIFGFDGWDRRTLAPRCVWEQTHRGETSVLYTATVRVKVHAGASTIARDGVGTGFCSSSSRATAHEIALKGAETDATKRALATFGNPFGLALYDKAKAAVTRGARSKGSQCATAYILHSFDGSQVTASSADTYLAFALSAIAAMDQRDQLYAFWEANKAELRRLRATHEELPKYIEQILAAMKKRARELEDRLNVSKVTVLPADDVTKPGRLLIPKERRVRSKGHLDFVRQQPCLICGRSPSHAHHVKFAQHGALGMKVSDEFTVPLCSLHHDGLHRVGNERSWWTGQGIDPLKTAADLWERSQNRLPAEEEN